MAEVSISVKLKVVKEVIATCFINATELCTTEGLFFKYKSYSYKDEEVEGWKFDIIVKELGYPERTIQEFRFRKPAEIDNKSIEYHVIVEVLTLLTQGALLSWYQLAKMLATDKEFQEQAKMTKNGESKNIITSHK